jgi:hypothetical protein
LRPAAAPGLKANISAIIAAGAKNCNLLVLVDGAEAGIVSKDPGTKIG